MQQTWTQVGEVASCLSWGSWRGWPTETPAIHGVNAALGKRAGSSRAHGGHTTQAAGPGMSQEVTFKLDCEESLWVISVQSAVSTVMFSKTPPGGRESGRCGQTTLFAPQHYCFKKIRINVNTCWGRSVLKQSGGVVKMNCCDWLKRGCQIINVNCSNKEMRMWVSPY